MRYQRQSLGVERPMLPFADELHEGRPAPWIEVGPWIQGVRGQNDRKPYVFVRYPNPQVCVLSYAGYLLKRLVL